MENQPCPEIERLLGVFITYPNGPYILGHSGFITYPNITLDFGTEWYVPKVYGPLVYSEYIQTVLICWDIVNSEYIQTMFRDKMVCPENIWTVGSCCYIQTVLIFRGIVDS